MFVDYLAWLGVLVVGVTLVALHVWGIMMAWKENKWIVLGVYGGAALLAWLVWAIYHLCP